MLRCLSCTRPALPRHSRCAEHQRQHQNARNAKRGGTGWIWQATRERIIARDGGCRMPEPHEGKLNVDHRTPLSEGGDNSDANLWTLCEAHHRVKGREVTA